MSKPCAFCGSTSGLTREHVFPNWMAKLFKAKTRVTNVASSDAGQRKWESAVFQLQTRAVCASCNHGWMSKLETAVKPLLTEIAFTRNPLELKQEEETALAFWAQKTAMMLNLTNTAGFRIPQTHFEVLHQEQGPDSRILTQMGWRLLDGPEPTESFGGVQTHQVPSASVPKDHFEAIKNGGGVIWTATLHVGYVVFKMIGHNLGPGLQLQVGVPDPKLMVQIFPYASDIHWPTEWPIDAAGGLAQIQQA